MVKVPTPFAEVACPVCDVKIECGIEKPHFLKHINEKRPKTLKLRIVQDLFRKLNLSIPDNIDKINLDQMDELLVNMCKYKAIREGLGGLKRNHSSNYRTKTEENFDIQKTPTC